MSTGTTPGRAACEAFWAAVGAGPDTQDPAAAWDWAFSQDTTRAWEAAAEAAAGARLTAAPDGTLTAAGRLADVLGQLAEARAGLAKSREGARMLGKIVVGQTRAMQAARIELAQGSAEKAMQWILNSLPDVWDDPEAEWDGRESAAEWWDRTDSFYREAEKPRTPSGGAGPSVDTPRALPTPPDSARDDLGASPPSPGVALIGAERARQVAVEGYTPEHDARHVNGELTAAAVHYIHAAGWPSGLPAAQSGDVVDSLVKAGALIAAEIDRLTGRG
jgi:hypothetical protein